MAATTKPEEWVSDLELSVCGKFYQGFVYRGLLILCWPNTAWLLSQRSIWSEPGRIHKTNETPDRV